MEEKEFCAKRYLLGLVMSTITTIIIFYMLTIFIYPFSIQRVHSKMEHYDVISYSEQHGILVFVMRTDAGYASYVFAKNT